jgi:hypothetical protein
MMWPSTPPTHTPVTSLIPAITMVASWDLDEETKKLKAQSRLWSEKDPGEISITKCRHWFGIAVPVPPLCQERHSERVGEYPEYLQALFAKPGVLPDSSPQRFWLFNRRSLSRSFGIGGARLVRIGAEIPHLLFCRILPSLRLRRGGPLASNAGRRTRDWPPRNQAIKIGVFLSTKSWHYF